MIHALVHDPTERVAQLPKIACSPRRLLELELELTRING
jgi:hypothetical protein